MPHKPLVTIMDDSIKALSVETRKIVDAQTSPGNWNYDSYMHGMANGMLLMQAMIDGVQPDYLEAPEEWLCDRNVFPTINSRTTKD